VAVWKHLRSPHLQEPLSQSSEEPDWLQAQHAEDRRFNNRGKGCLAGGPIFMLLLLPLSLIEGDSVFKWVTGLYCLILLILIAWLGRRLTQTASIARYTIYTIAVLSGIGFAFVLFALPA
jgi:hypothetical protein